MVEETRTHLPPAEDVAEEVEEEEVSAATMLAFNVSTACSNKERRGGRSVRFDDIMVEAEVEVEVEVEVEGTMMEGEASAAVVLLLRGVGG